MIALVSHLKCFRNVELVSKLPQGNYDTSDTEEALLQV
jgi:hypothetical protein